MDDEERNPANDQVDDYKYSRFVYYELLKSGMEVLPDLVTLTKETEHPQAYSVMAAFIKNMADVNDKLVDTQRKMQVIEKEAGRTKQLDGPANPQIAFRGSTEDVLKLMKAEADRIKDADYSEVSDETDDKVPTESP